MKSAPNQQRYLLVLMVVMVVIPTLGVLAFAFAYLQGGYATDIDNKWDSASIPTIDSVISFLRVSELERYATFTNPDTLANEQNATEIARMKLLKELSTLRGPAHSPIQDDPATHVALHLLNGSLWKHVNESRVDLAIDAWSGSHQRLLDLCLVIAQRTHDIQKILVLTAIVRMSHLAEMLGVLRVVGVLLLRSWLTHTPKSLLNHFAGATRQAFALDDSLLLTTPPALLRIYREKVPPAMQTVRSMARSIEESALLGKFSFLPAKEGEWSGNVTSVIDAVYHFTVEAGTKRPTSIEISLAAIVTTIVLAAVFAALLMYTLNEMERVGRRRDEMLDFVFHEMRNPAHYLGHAVATMPPELANEWSDYRDVTGTVQRLTKTLDDMNTILHYERTKPVDKVSADIEIVLKDSGATSFEVSPEVPRMMYLHLPEVRMILRQVIYNAKRFSKEGHPPRISCHCPSRRSLRVDVTDKGPGLEPTQIASLFSDFTVQKVSAVRKHGGSGLGLAIAHKAAKSIGATVAVTWTELGVGSTFTVTVPFEFAPPPDTEALAETQMVLKPIIGGQNLKHVSHISVLFVDDVELNRRVGVKMLKSCGVSEVNITTAANGLQSIEEYKKASAADTPFDIVFMDLMMPVMDGFEATKQIRFMDPWIPIVTLSGSTGPKDRVMAMEHGSTFFLVKPCRMEQFHRIIASYSVGSKQSLI